MMPESADVTKVVTFVVVRCYGGYLVCKMP